MALTTHHFVLVHGAGHGAWCWVRIVPGLEKAGHRVTTLDLVGGGDSPLSAHDCASFEQYNQPLEDLFRSFPADEKVILVGHSAGGLSITYISEHFPKNICAAVYLSAFMPGLGVSIIDMVMRDQTFLPQLTLELEAKVEGGSITAQGLSEADLKQYVYSECTSEDLDIGIKNVRAFPMLDKILSPINLTQDNYGSVPKIFILALDDKLISPANAHKMIELNPPNEIIEISGDHSTFFSNPNMVVKVLLDIAAKSRTNYN